MKPPLPSNPCFQAVRLLLESFHNVWSSKRKYVCSFTQISGRPHNLHLISSSTLLDLPYPAVTPLCLPHFSFISFLSRFPSRLFLGRVSSIMHDVVLLGSLSFRMMCMYACVAYTLSTIHALCLLLGLLCIYSTVNTSPVWGCDVKCKPWDALAIRRPAVQTWQFRKPGNEYTYCTFYTWCKQSNTPTSSWADAWLSLTLHFFWHPAGLSLLLVSLIYLWPFIKEARLISSLPDFMCLHLTCAPQLCCHFLFPYMSFLSPFLTKL